MRWALVLGDDARRKAFWDFAGDVVTAPVSESVFERRFGLSFDELDVALTDILIDVGGVIPEFRLPVDPSAGRSRGIVARTAHPGEVEALRQALDRPRPPDWFSYTSPTSRIRR